MKELTKILFEVGMLVMGRTSQQFELFGLDFMVDWKYQVWLIECNSNPSIDICCSLLNKLVPNMLDNLLTIAVDPYFPPSEKKVMRTETDFVSDKFNFELLLDASQEN